MKTERICAICEEKLSKKEGNIVKDGSLVCDDCLENDYACCDECGEYVLFDEMKNYGDDMRLCPDCYSELFPSFDIDKNIKDTTEAYEAMKKRLIGKQTNHDEGCVDIETEMNDDGFKYEISVDIDFRLYGRT